MRELIPHIDSRESRFNIRASQHQKDIISEAARVKHTTVSNFVLGTAYQEAQKILANETNFKLPSHKWKAFCGALDRNPQSIKPLRKLLTQSGVFDND